MRVPLLRGHVLPLGFGAAPTFCRCGCEVALNIGHCRERSLHRLCLVLLWHCRKPGWSGLNDAQWRSMRDKFPGIGIQEMERQFVAWNCRRKVEMSPVAQSRNDTPIGDGHD